MKRTLLCLVMALALPAMCARASDDEPVRIDAQKRPQLVKRVDPSYPAEAAKLGVQGLVQLEATINPAGDVVDIRVLPAKDPQPLLEQAAIAALRQWKYEPYVIAGRARAVIFTVTMNFALQKEKKPASGDKASPRKPKLITRVNPIYPVAALEQKIQGIVVIEATMNENGDVASARVLPGENPQPLLDEAALAAVRQWKYEPVLVDGKARKVTFTVTVKFSLKEDKPSDKTR